MPADHWGLLGPENLSSTRRTRTLGVGAAVRAFNDFAVPGLGSVWFAKQIVLALLGVAVAQNLRRKDLAISNVEVANAIEALSCWLGFSTLQDRRDPRLRGSSKLPYRRVEQVTFNLLRSARAYVTQPMRMATVQVLPALGLVHAESMRFNAFACPGNCPGAKLLDAAFDGYKPARLTVPDLLGEWVRGRQLPLKSDPLRQALSPIEDLAPEARQYLRERLMADPDEGGLRRRRALEWMNSLTRSAEISWADKPAMISDAHWRDLHCGAMFFIARDAAISLLDRVEGLLACQAQYRATPESVGRLVASQLELLRSRATDFLKAAHDPTPDRSATAFCRECVGANEVEIIAAMVRRDEHVLVLKNGEIQPGPAFSGSAAFNDEMEASAEPETLSPETGSIEDWPSGISFRIRNLFLLSLDLEGRLDQRLKERQS